MIDRLLILLVAVQCLAVLHPNIRDPGWQVFMLRLSGTQELRFQPPVSMTHMQATVELLDMQKETTIRMKLKRDGQQQISQREFSQVENLDFLLYPQRNYSLILESDSEVLVRISTRKYLKNSGIQLTSKQEFQQLETELLSIRERLTNIAEPLQRSSSSAKNTLLSWSLVVLKCVESMILAFALLSQQKEAKRYVDTSRHLI